MMKAFKIPFIISTLFLTCCCQKDPLPDVSPLKCNFSSADISTLEVGKTATGIPGNRCEKEGPVDADVYAARFVSKGGEPFCEYQMETRDAFKSETVFFAGYTNGQNAYLASKRGYQVRKGYEYEIEQMHIYTKSPYPLSETMPDVYQSSITETIS